MKVKVSKIKYVVDEFLDNLQGDVSQIDKRELNKIMRRCTSGYEDYLFKSYLYSSLEPYFIRFSNGKEVF